MKKKSLILALTTVLVLSNVFNSFAAWYKTGPKWIYRDDMTWLPLTDCAQWIDGNNDGMELVDGQPRTVNLSQVKDSINNGFFKKEFLDLFGYDKNTVDSMFGAGTPLESEAHWYIYVDGAGRYFLACYSSCGRLEGIGGNADDICNYTKDYYTYDELDGVMGRKRDDSSIPVWRLTPEDESLYFAHITTYDRLENAIGKNDGVRIYLPFLGPPLEIKEE